jgi:hypothetical protein
LLLLCVREAAKSRVLAREGPEAAAVGADEGPRFVREPAARPMSVQRR